MANPKGIGGQKSGEPGRNPTGRPKGYQSPVDRMRRWFENNTAGEILAILNDPEEKWKNLCAMDVAIIQRVKESFEKDGRQSLDGLLDRLLGKPPQHITQDLNASIENRPVSETLEWIRESLRGKEAKPPKKPVSG